MVDIVFLVRRRQELSPEEFHRYWRDEHGPLVKRYAGALGIRRYTQLHTLDTPLAEVLRAGRNCDADVFDGVALVSFESVDTLGAAASTAEGQNAGRALLEDERRFLDLERCVISFAEPHEVIA
jgi:uncharacterized protein (TIGR02118 family)